MSVMVQDITISLWVVWRIAMVRLSSSSSLVVKRSFSAFSEGEICGLALVSLAFLQSLSHTIEGLM